MAQKKKIDPKDVMIKTFLATAVIALPLGFAVGQAIANSDEDTPASHTTEKEQSYSHDSHAHQMFGVEAAGAPVISDLRVERDAKSGWNISFTTSNFTFAPQNASGQHVDGQGHAHLYLNDKKVTRLYANNYYIEKLGEGMVEVRVTLNTNNHLDYAVNGEVVAASTTVSASEAPHQDESVHDHEHDIEGGSHDHTH